MCDVSDNNNEAKQQIQNDNNKNYCIVDKENNNITTTTLKATTEATTTTTTEATATSTSEELSVKALNVFQKLARERNISAYKLETRPVSGIGENSYGLVLQVKLIPTTTTTTKDKTNLNNNNNNNNVENAVFINNNNNNNNNNNKNSNNNNDVISTTLPFVTILKISPKNAARRTHMKVADYYSREVFMYEKVLHEYRKYQKPTTAQQQQQNTKLPNDATVAAKDIDMDVAPEMFYSSLAHEDEFIIFEDLTEKNYTQNSRIKMPTFDLVVTALEALAKLHAMSFILQTKQPKLFMEFVEQMTDNLFTPQIETVSIEFGKKYVRRTRLMLEEELEQRRERHYHHHNHHNHHTRRVIGAQQQQQQQQQPQQQRLCVNVLHKIEDNFKDICLNCVNGAANAPYAVICHGDFWNNNILYKFDSDNRATSAKLVDFQMSRYAPPVSDLMYYLFACTEKELRDAHFSEFLDIYYKTLTQRLSHYGLNPNVTYPHDVFAQQLRDFGVYGFCMSAFAIPFFISNTSEIPDLDEVSEAIRDLSSASSSSDMSDDSDDGFSVNNKNNSNNNNNNNNNNKNKNNNNVKEQQANNLKKCKDADEHKCRELVEEYELLTTRTLPIFKRRMTGIVADLVKYDMIENLMKL